MSKIFNLNLKYLVIGIIYFLSLFTILSSSYSLASTLNDDDSNLKQECVDKFSDIDIKDSSSSKKLFSKIKGHLFLLTTVGAGFFFTSKITASIPDEYSYISSIVTFASGMAVVAIGAPIFRKIFPIIDQQAFKISSYKFDPIEQDSQNLREIWESLNKYFDVNSQMGVNQLIKVQELISSTVTRIFLEPKESRQQYATAQFIWLASIYYKYFYYISLNDKTTISTINSLFYSHTELDFTKLVNDCYNALEIKATSDKEKKYYKYLLNSWFKDLM